MTYFHATFSWPTNNNSRYPSLVIGDDPSRYDLFGGEVQLVGDKHFGDQLKIHLPFSGLPWRSCTQLPHHKKMAKLGRKPTNVTCGARTFTLLGQHSSALAVMSWD